MPARTLRRALRRAALAWRRPNVDLVASSDYRHPLPGGLQDPLRAARLLAFLRDAGLVDERRLHRPAPVSLWQLRLVHDDDYLERLERPGALEKAFGVRLAAALEQRLLEVQRAMVGGTLLASRLARRGRGVAINFGGGLHHAKRDRAQGFCLYNDVAVAIEVARREGFDGPVAVLDLDLHDGDGTRSLFADDPTVHTYSLHSRNWDAAGGVESTAIELGVIEDGKLLATLSATLPPLLDRLRPALAFYLAGCDAAADDALGDGRMTAAGIFERDRTVAHELARRKIPMVVLLAGGYGDASWRYSARFLAWLLAGREIEPPTTGEQIVDRFRHIAGSLPVAVLRGEPTDALLTAEDLTEALGVEAPDSRFLGYYTPAGVELALERLGYIDELRALGFDRPQLDFDLANPSGHTLRVFADSDRRELLVEMRLRRDRGALAGFQMLRVEWLLLQNPRADFTPAHPRLPGQAHPGLGMLRETMAALVLVCDRLKLDGMVIAASRYYPAAAAHGEMVCLEPAEEGLLVSMLEALGELSLPVAAELAEEGALVDVETGEPVVWRPLTMVYPVSAALRAHFEQPDYRERVAAARRPLRLREPVEGGR
jgi:acetoin utilization deacetylase AcuC-like enzyme